MTLPPQFDPGLWMWETIRRLLERTSKQEGDQQ